MSTRRAARAVGVYTLGRVGLFVLVAGLLYLVGFTAWLAALLGVVLSGLLSWYLLGPQRAAMGAAVADALAGQRRRFAERTAAEDAVAEQIVRQQEALHTDSSEVSPR